MITKRWLLHTALVLGVIMLVGQLPSAIRLVLTPLTAALLVATSASIAQSTYYKRSIVKGLRSGLKGLLRLSLLVAIYQAAIMALLGVGGTMVTEVAADIGINRAGDFIGGHWALFGLMMCWAGSKRDDFFLIPLMVGAELGWAEAGRLSRLGVDRNSFVFLINLGAVFVCGLAMLLSGVLAAPLLPLSGALLFVAYKHVYLLDDPKPEGEELSSERSPTVMLAD